MSHLPFSYLTQNPCLPRVRFSLVMLPGPAIGSRRQLKRPGQGSRFSHSFYFWNLFPLTFVFFVGNQHVKFVCMLQALFVFATGYTYGVCLFSASVNLVAMNGNWGRSSPAAGANYPGCTPAPFKVNVVGHASIVRLTCTP
jgi:hypothetical protein